VVAIRAWLVSHSVCPCSARKPDVYATKAQARSDVILYIDGFNNMGAGTQPRATAGPMETLWLSTARPDGVEEDTADSTGRRNTSIMEVDYGTSNGLDGHATRAGADAVAGPAAGVAPGAPAGFLGPRRAGSLERGGWRAGRRVGAGRDSIFPSRWRDARRQQGIAFRKILNLRRA
jgi:hypothetical protein